MKKAVITREGIDRLASTSPRMGPEKIDFEKFSKEIEQVIQRLGDAPQIAGIVITNQIPHGMRRETHTETQKVYVLINRETWGKLLSLFENVESDTISQIAGLPVFEDEDLARRILQDWKVFPWSRIVPPGMGGASL